MPNFTSTPIANSVIQIGIHVRPTGVDIFDAEKWVWIASLESIEKAIEYMRDNMAPLNATAIANAYDVRITYFPNNAGPWAGQGAGLNGPYSG